MATPIKNMVHPERPVMFCMLNTALDANQKLDEQGIKTHIDRMAEAGVGVYVGSGGSGEGSSLEIEDLDQLYKIAVKYGKGRIPVYSNPREAHTAKEMYEISNLAVKAGIDVVQLYQLQQFHFNTPNVFEQEGYYRYILDRINHPIAISIHQASGYLAPVDLTIKLVNDYKQIVVVNMHGPNTQYMLRLKASVRPEVKLYMGSANVLTTLALGGWGAQAAEPNYAPKLTQMIIDHFIAGDMKKAGEAAALMMKMMDALAVPPPYGVPASPSRNVKTALAALGLPGGPPRLPYMMPPQDVIMGIRVKAKAIKHLIPDWQTLPALA